MESQSFSSSSSTTKRPPPSFHSAVHSVRKIPAKPWKKPNAPPQPNPPRIYKVKSVDFKQLVQKLTGAAAESQSRRLQSVAPPPLTLSTSNSDFEAAGPTLERLLSPSLDAVSPLGFGLSPSSSRAWCSFLLLSPGSLSSLEHSKVL